MKTTFVFLFFSFSALASSEGGFPIKEIGFQILNFSIFLSLFLFFLKKLVQSFFRARKEQFLQEEKEARQKEVALKREHSLWTDKIKDLLTEKKNLNQKIEEEKIRYEIQKKSDIQDLSERLERERRFVIQLEQQKLKTQVMINIKEEIIDQAKQKLISEGDQLELQARLQKSFSDQLERGL